MIVMEVLELKRIYEMCLNSYNRGYTLTGKIYNVCDALHTMWWYGDMAAKKLWYYFKANHHSHGLLNDEEQKLYTHFGYLLLI